MKKSATEQLKEAGVDFEVCDRGTRILVILGGGKFIDFWPSAGTWIVHGTGTKRRGILKLIEFIQSVDKSQPVEYSWEE